MTYLVVAGEPRNIADGIDGSQFFFAPPVWGAEMSFQGAAGPGLAGRGRARLGQAWQGSARQGKAWTRRGRIAPKGNPATSAQKG